MKPKLTTQQKEDIRIRYELGETISRLARVYNVCRNTIKYTVNENFKKQLNENLKEYHQKYQKKRIENRIEQLKIKLAQICQ